ARHLPETDQRVLLESFLKSDRLCGFELTRAPMLRLKLFQWSAQSFSLVWTFHHALLDGRSFPALLGEVVEAYTELAVGKIAARPQPPRYQRYIDWLAQQEFGTAEAFWRDLLTGFKAPTPLVIDRKGQAENDVHQQGEAWEILSGTATSQLHKLARDHNVTVNAIVMAAWAILLHRYSGEEDIVFGATRAGRKSSVSQADETAGIFINTVPVRVSVWAEAPILNVFKAVRGQWLEMRPFEHTPLVRVK